MALITINGLELPDPSTYDFTFSDMDTENTGRDLDFKLLRQRKRARVYSIAVAWANIRIDDLGKITLATDPEFFSVKFYDLVKKQFLTKTMYAGNRAMTTKLIKSDYSNALGSISFNLIEQ